MAGHGGDLGVKVTAAGAMRSSASQLESRPLWPAIVMAC